MKTINRRQSIKTIAAGTAMMTLSHTLSGQAQNESKEYWMFVGNYTSGDHGGIFTCKFNAEDGSLTKVANSGGIKNPSFLALTPNHQFLYSVSEISDFNGERSGGISAFQVDLKTGLLKPLNQQSTIGQGPCYVTVDQTGKWVLAANYGSGNVCILPIHDSGMLEPAANVHQHEGSSVNKGRQEGPHAHCIVLSPDNKYAFSADLGTDSIFGYELDLEKGEFIPLDQVKTQPGSGPRHIAFHPNGKLVFSIQELDSTINSYQYEAEFGFWTHVQTVSSLPVGYSSANSCADIHVHPNGKFVYGSNRGHDTIVIYAVNDETGEMTLVKHESTLGETPRNFAIDPTGEFLLAENQKSNNIQVFRIDGETGLLTHTGNSLEIPTPVCIKFAPVEG